MRNKKTVEKHQRLFILLPLVMGVFLWSLSAGIINISLPTLSQYLDISTNMVAWVVIIHLVILTSFLLIFGRVGDFIGYKKIFIMGLFIFASGTYLCAVSLNFYHLLLFRIIQGIGSSMLLSVIPAMVTLSFSPENRGKAFGYISLASTFPA
ncbi:MAG: MFS transporter [Methanobacteriaceae archaeon]|nr:MFS transporter [Methanobacteriaceae archaeon]MDP3484646.1 MFS transporter [Methanobacteriaceae archaeon]MDP3622564.1 MFS transporter [Methanobacteriaceae archaeon]